MSNHGIRPDPVAFFSDRHGSWVQAASDGLGKLRPGARGTGFPRLARLLRQHGRQRQRSYITHARVGDDDGRRQPVISRGGETRPPVHSANGFQAYPDSLPASSVSVRQRPAFARFDVQEEGKLGRKAREKDLEARLSCSRGDQAGRSSGCSARRSSLPCWSRGWPPAR